MFYKGHSDWRFSDLYGHSLKLFFRYFKFYSPSLGFFFNFSKNPMLCGPFLGKFEYNLTFFTKRVLIEGFFTLLWVKFGIMNTAKCFLILRIKTSVPSSLFYWKNWLVDKGVLYRLFFIKQIECSYVVVLYENSQIRFWGEKEYK